MGDAQLATLSVDGRSLIGVRQGRIVVADATSGEIRADHDILGIKVVARGTSGPFFPAVEAVSVAADGRTAAVAATTDMAVISETDTRCEIGPLVTIGLMDLETGAVVILPDGVTLVAASLEGIWRGPIDDWASATMAKLQPRTNSTIQCLCASPDGALVATGDGGGRIIIWDVPTLRPRQVLDTGDGG